jgi:hypothetical protein
MSMRTIAALSMLGVGGVAWVGSEVMAGGETDKHGPSLTQRVERLERLVRGQAGAIADLEGQLAATEARLAATEGSVGDASSVLAAQAAELAALGARTAPLAMALVDGAPALVIDGVNVYVRDGSGDTACDEGADACSGLGNLIVGYGAGDGASGGRRGTHNLVVGDYHGYDSYGGLLAGTGNLVAAPYAVAVGGFNNAASAFGAVVTGGQGNRASGEASVVGGGAENSAEGFAASVGGGFQGESTGFASSVSGGRSAVASGDYAWTAGAR